MQPSAHSAGRAPHSVRATGQRKLPELDGRDRALAMPSTTAPTADGDSATPPSAPSSLSTSPSSTAASPGAVLLTWAPNAHR